MNQIENCVKFTLILPKHFEVNELYVQHWQVFLEPQLYFSVHRPIVLKKSELHPAKKQNNLWNCYRHWIRVSWTIPALDCYVFSAQNWKFTMSISVKFSSSSWEIQPLFLTFIHLTPSRLLAFHYSWLDDWDFGRLFGNTVKKRLSKKRPKRLLTNWYSFYILKKQFFLVEN